MKVKLVILLQSFALFSAALAQHAFLYAFNTPTYPKRSPPTTVSSDIGLAVISRRRNNCRNDYIGDADTEVLELIDSLSGFQQPIFGQTSSAPLMKVFLRIEGYSSDDMHHIDLPPADLTISHPTTDYLLSLRPGGEEYCAYGENKMGDYSMYIDGTINKEYTVSKDGGECKLVDIFQKTSLGPLGQLAVAIQELVDSSSDKQVLRSFSFNFPTVLSILENLASKHKIQSTVLLLPSPSNLTVSSARISRRMDADESPLDLPPFSDSESQPLLASIAKNLPSKIPTCFASKSACENSTNSCSGHGSCAASLVNSKCFQCKCRSTVIRTNPDGSTQSWSWAGAACEKKDISIPFWLFASFGVTMTTLIAGGIGMLYGMGKEELPSVLGAGVAGPRASK